MSDVAGGSLGETLWYGPAAPFLHKSPIQHRASHPLHRRDTIQIWLCDGPPYAWSKRHSPSGDGNGTRRAPSCTAQQAKDRERRHIHAACCKESEPERRRRRLLILVLLLAVAALSFPASREISY